MTQDQAALLKQAIVQGMNERYARELSEATGRVKCSAAHSQKMSEILGFDVLAKERARKRRILAAALILAATLAIGSFTAYAHREQIREFFIQVFDDYIALEFPGEQPHAYIAEVYELSYMPPDYELSVKQISSTDVYYQWNDTENKMFAYYQVLLNAEIGFDSESGSTTLIEHNGLVIYCKKYENSIYYVWNDGKYAMEICDQSDLPIEEILKIIENIKIKQ